MLVHAPKIETRPTKHARRRPRFHVIDARELHGLMVGVYLFA